MGTSITLEIQFYSHLLEYFTTLVACTGANWQQYNQATVANGILEIGKADVVRPPDIRRPKRTAPYLPTAQGQKRQVGPIDYAPKASQDNVEDMEIVEQQLTPMVPIPAFVAATLMEGYESDPIELCWKTIEEILKRASADENAADAIRLGEVASYVPRWLFSTAVNVRLAANSSTPFGVSNRSVRHLRMDEWTQEVHRRHLAVRARSILGGTRQQDSAGEPRTRSGICHAS